MKHKAKTKRANRTAKRKQRCTSNTNWRMHDDADQTKVEPSTGRVSSSHAEPSYSGGLAHLPELAFQGDRTPRIQENKIVFEGTGTLL